MHEDKVDLVVDPEVSLLEEISPIIASNIEMVFNKLESLVEKSMNKQDNNYCDGSQKKKARKELDSNMKTCILNVSSEDGFDPAESLADFVKIIMSKKPPPQSSYSVILYDE